MKLSKLVEHLSDLLQKHGDVEVDIITESEFNSAELIEIVKYRAIQVEQPLGDIAFDDKRVKLLPEGF